MPGTIPGADDLQKDERPSGRRPPRSGRDGEGSVECS